MKIVTRFMMLSYKGTKVTEKVYAKHQVSDYLMKLFDSPEYHSCLDRNPPPMRKPPPITGSQRFWRSDPGDNSFWASGRLRRPEKFTFIG